MEVEKRYAAGTETSTGIDSSHGGDTRPVARPEDAGAQAEGAAVGVCSPPQPPPDEGDDHACLICLGDTGDEAVRLSCCRHAYHPACLKKWIARSNSCPHCRAAALDPDQQPPTWLLPNVPSSPLGCVYGPGSRRSSEDSLSVVVVYGMAGRAASEWARHNRGGALDNDMPAVGGEPGYAYADTDDADAHVNLEGARLETRTASQVVLTFAALLLLTCGVFIWSIYIILTCFHHDCEQSDEGDSEGD